jgi:hypothetical protein
LKPESSKALALNDLDSIKVGFFRRLPATKPVTTMQNTTNAALRTQSFISSVYFGQRRVSYFKRI